MTKQALIQYGLQFPAVYEDYPFDDNWAALRHAGNQKTFAFIYEHNGVLCMNVKGDPLKNEWAARHFPFVTPAYHMNKVYWVTLSFADASLTIEDVADFVDQSYELTKPKIRGIKS